MRNYKPASEGDGRRSIEASCKVGVSQQCTSFPASSQEDFQRRADGDELRDTAVLEIHADFQLKFARLHDSF